MTNAVARQEDAIRRIARRGLAIYFGTVLVLSVAAEAYIISYPQRDRLIAALMLVPTLASVVVRLFLREGFADVSFRWGGRRGRHYTGLALGFPVAVGLIAYGTAWATGLVGFVPPPTDELLGAFVSFLVGCAVSLILVSGEEIGWRGYMLTRLIDAGVPRPVLASGLI